MNFSLRLTFTEEAEGGNEGFVPVFGVLDMGVLSEVGLKPDGPKVKGAADVATGATGGSGPGSLWEEAQKRRWRCQSPALLWSCQSQWGTVGAPQ